MRYAGLFARATHEMEVAIHLQHKLEGRATGIRYNPANPSISALVQRQFEVLRAMQSPHWL